MQRGVLVALVVCVAMAGGVAAESGSGHATPKDVQVLCGTGSATVSWSAVSDPGLIGYNVYDRVTGGGAYGRANADPVTTTSFLVAGLLGGTSYDFGVTAVYADGESAMAGPVTCTTN